MIKVFFIAKIKNHNKEYYKIEEKLLEELKKYSGFISIQTDIIDDVEITVSSWKSKKDVEMWAKNPLHLKAKNKVEEWYYWVKGIHMETIDE